MVPNMALKLYNIDYGFSLCEITLTFRYSKQAGRRIIFLTKFRGCWACTFWLLDLFTGYQDNGFAGWEATGLYHDVLFPIYDETPSQFDKCLMNLVTISLCIVTFRNAKPLSICCFIKLYFFPYVFTVDCFDVGECTKNSRISGLSSPGKEGQLCWSS